MYYVLSNGDVGFLIDIEDDEKDLLSVLTQKLTVTEFSSVKKVFSKYTIIKRVVLLEKRKFGICKH